MFTAISKLKIILINEETNQLVSHAKVYWDIIPESVKNKNVFCKQYKESDNGLQIDVTNSAGFSVLWGELIHKKQLWFYIYKINCLGFKESVIERKFAVKVGTEREISIYLISSK